MMKKKNLIKFLNRQYKNLSDREKKAQKRLFLLNSALCAFISVIVKDAYIYCQIDGKTDYSRLLHRISKAEARDLQSQVRKIKILYGDELPNDAFPFTLARFDNIHRLDMYKARIICSCLETGYEQRKLIKKHLLDYSYLFVTELVAYISVTSVVAGRIADDIVAGDNYIPESTVTSMYQTAIGATQRLQQALMRGETAGKASDTVAEYIARKTKQDTDRLLFTEGTRVSNESAKAVIEPYADYFYTVPVMDDKTCQVCIDIANEQKMNPVPMSEFVTGVTAPPFHPWCRCKFEVIFK